MQPLQIHLNSCQILETKQTAIYLHIHYGQHVTTAASQYLSRDETFLSYDNKAMWWGDFVFCFFFLFLAFHKSQNVSVGIGYPF